MLRTSEEKLGLKDILDNYLKLRKEHEDKLLEGDQKANVEKMLKTSVRMFSKNTSNQLEEPMLSLGKTFQEIKSKATEQWVANTKALLTDEHKPATDAKLLEAFKQCLDGMMQEFGDEFKAKLDLEEQRRFIKSYTLAALGSLTAAVAKTTIKSSEVAHIQKLLNKASDVRYDENHKNMHDETYWKSVIKEAQREEKQREVFKKYSDKLDTQLANLKSQKIGLFASKEKEAINPTLKALAPLVDENVPERNPQIIIDLLKGKDKFIEFFKEQLQEKAAKKTGPQNK